MKICAFVGDMYRDYSASIILTLQAKAIEKGHTIDLFGNCSVPSENPLHSEGLRSILALPKLENYDGIIICSDTLNHAGLNKVLLDRLIATPNLPPTVSIRVDEPGFYSIVPDNRSIMYDISKYVIGKVGCDDIGFVTGRDDLKDSQERRAGFEDAMEEAGLPIREEMIFHGNYWTNQGPETADFYTKPDGTLPKAIICSNDYMAIALMDELQKRGYTIPDDTMITGIDNIEASAIHVPSLTTSDIPETTLANAAIDCLERVLAGETFDMNVTVPGRLILRESSNDEINKQDVNEMHRKLDAIQRNYYDNTRAFVLMCSEYGDILNFEDCSKLTLMNLRDTKVCSEVFLCRHGENDNFLMGYCNKDSCSISSAKFPLHALLPKEYDMKKPGLRVFLPIFFKSEVYGHAALTLDPDSMFFIDEKLEFVLTLMGQTLNRLNLYTKLSEANDIMDLYVKDSLTGLYNRRGFEENISKVFKNGLFEQHGIAVVSIDMDGLKWINDNLGHPSGDEALKATASCLERALQPNEFGARMGGDEFSAILVLDNTARVGQFIRKFRNEIKEFNKTSNAEYTVSASVGTCEVPSWDLLMESINKADKIMYVEKRTKKHSRTSMEESAPTVNPAEIADK